jgi:2-iminobutanoate/2-iminopropanoate deaminase
VLSAIRDTLDEIGLAMDRIVRVEVHLADLDQFDAMDTAYREFFQAGNYPARTTTESKRLFGDSRVEITCQARL